MSPRRETTAMWAGIIAAIAVTAAVLIYLAVRPACPGGQHLAQAGTTTAPDKGGNVTVPVTACEPAR